jgi:hypothetical protein
MEEIRKRKAEKMKKPLKRNISTLQSYSSRAWQNIKITGILNNFKEGFSCYGQEYKNLAVQKCPARVY